MGRCTYYALARLNCCTCLSKGIELGNKIKLLVTGLNGVVGQALFPALESRYEISALSRSGVEGIPQEKVLRADIADIDAIQPAFIGIDVVLHLAADGGIGSPDGQSAPWDSMLSNNIVGTYNVLQCALNEGVSRVILASSGATVNGYELEDPYKQLVAEVPEHMPEKWDLIDEFAEPKPVSLYGVTKLFGEDLARFYALTTDMSVLNLRISSCTSEDSPKPGRSMANWSSYRDLQQLTIKCIEAPSRLKFDIFWATSDNARIYRDNSHAKDVLGYIPEDGAQ